MIKQQSVFSVISPIMAGPSSSHTAGALRLGLVAKNIYNKPFKKVEFVLYNSFAMTGLGHGTDKALLAGMLGFSVDSPLIKDVFNNIKGYEYSYKYVQDVLRFPNSVDIIIDNKMTVSGDSVGAGEIRITKINDFDVNLCCECDALLIMYKDKTGMISTISGIIQQKNINIATLNCTRHSKGGTAYMCIELDSSADETLLEQIENVKDVFWVTNIRKLA